MKKHKRQKPEKEQLSPQERAIRREFLNTFKGRIYRGLSERQLKVWTQNSTPHASRVFRNMLRQDRTKKPITSEELAA